MKKHSQSLRTHILALALLCLMPLGAMAEENRTPPILSQWQYTCNITIVGDFEAACVLPLEKDSYINEEPDVLLACQGMTVTYTAHVDMGGYKPDKWTWQIAGHVSYTDNYNGSVTVTWGDGSTGQLTVTVYGPDGVTCTKTVNVKLIEKPVISVATTPAYVEQPDGTKIIYVCKDETVEFTELSSTTNTDIVGYFWDSKMVGASSSPNYTIEHVWNDDEVIHRVYNNCGCYDEERYIIRMMDGEILDLGCYGTVCQGAVVTYSAIRPPCNQYFWYVDGGTIIKGQNTPQVTVQWDDPHDGYGVIALDGNLCGNHACPTMLSKKIPIIEDGLAIKGQTTACVGDAVVYSIPLFGSTEYTWSVTPAVGVSTVAVNGANEKTFVFHQPGTYQISVSYKCDFLECGEFTSAPLTVTVKPKLAITGMERICISNPCDLTTSPATSADWTIYDMDNGNHVVATAASNSSLSIPFPHPGKYRIVAANANFCSDAEFVLTVQDAPPAPTIYDIDANNPHTACPFDGVRLQANPQNPLHTIVWRPSCSSASPSEISGNDVTINYSGTVCNVNAYTYDRILNCLSSTPYVQQIEELELATIEMPHYMDVCPGTHILWDNSDIPLQDGVLYEWTIQNTMQHCASVQGDHMSNTIDFIVNEMTSGIYGYTFYMLLKRTVCHADYYDTFYIHVLDHVPATVSLESDTNSICPNAPFTFTGSGGDPSTYRWRVDGRLISFVGNPLVHSFANSGNHTVTVLYNEMDKCTNMSYYDSATVSINVCPLPVVNRIDYDASSHMVIADVDNGTYSFQWYYGGVLQVGETNPSMQTIGNGTYMCVVTNQCGCSVSKSKYIGSSTSGTVCEGVQDLDTTYNFCGAELQMHSYVSTPPTIYWSCSGNSTQRKLTINSSNRKYATVNFYDVGVYYIKSYTNGDDCQVSKTTHTVYFIPQFTFEKQCDRIVIHNMSKSLYGNEHIKFTVNESGSCEFDFSVKSYDYPVFSNGDYIFTLDIVVNGEHYTCTYDTIHFTTINNTTLTISTANTPNQTLTCDNTPIELTVTPTPYFPIASTTWNFGDGTKYTETGSSINHTFSSTSSNNPYTVSATVMDVNGCPIYTNTPLVITASSNNAMLNKLDALGTEVCPNHPRTIQFEYLGNALTSRDFYWNGASSFTTSYTYQTYNTGLYTGIAVNNYYCHVQDNINVTFKNKPTAIIVTEKQKYCMGEKVMLYGASGPDSADCSYSWDIINISTGQIIYRNTATSSFTPTMAGSYDIKLCVTNNTTGCSDCANTVTITVYDAPVAPTVGFGSRLCMDNPPVELIAGSPLTNEIHWSNGSTGPTAYYFTPGVATAWYYDPTSGCRSNDAHITIDAQPDFDALLTGCYEKCRQYFNSPRTLPVWGLTTGLQEIDWKWHLNGGGIANGYGNYTYSPLQLPLLGFGDYYLDVFYNNYNCNVKSPTLTISEKKYCDCENLDVTTHHKWDIKDCRLYYYLDVTVCNNADTKACLNKLEELFEQNMIKMPYTSFASGTVLYPGDCYTFTIMLDVSQFMPSSVVSFRLYDDCNMCTTDFSVDLMDIHIDCNIRMKLEEWNIRPDLSSSVASYVDFHMNVSPAQNVLAFWTEPSMVFNYWYDGAAFVHGLLMFDNAVISQLAMEDGRICFYAITCEGNKLCQRRYCISAKMIYEALEKMGIKPKNAMNTNSTDTEEETEMLMPSPNNASDTDPRLMPNPTTGEVNVVGTNDEVVEVLVLDMNGRQVAVFEQTANFDIAPLSSGMYIVRVKTLRDKTENVTYLKLVKK